MQDPDSPDTPYVMNPVWQTLDLVFRKYLLPDPTVSQQLKDAYANDFAKIFDLFRQNPNGVFAGPYSVNPKLTTK